MSELDTPTELTQTLVLYHDNCIDGFTAAWACKHGLIKTCGVDKHDIHLQPVQYGVDPGLLLTIITAYKEVYMVDFSVPPDVLKELAKQTMIYIFDHHKTAFEAYGASEQEVALIGDINFRVHLNNDESGASLVYKYFFPQNKLPTLVAHVKDYDLWRFEYSADTIYLNRYLRIQTKTYENWEALVDTCEESISYMQHLMQGATLDAAHNQLCNRLVNAGKTPITLAGEEGLSCNAPSELASDIGHKLARESGTYGAVWNQGKEGKVCWSLRSVGDYDVSAIAKKFGGGGHRNAAGFELLAPTDDGTPFTGITIWNTELEVEDNGE